VGKAIQSSVGIDARASAKRKRRDSTPPPIRVAIVGGGCAGVAAAWQITEFNRTRTTPVSETAPAFEVTVYERSCRLGGKGGSWRDDAGRIREHGLHIWLGFYENAFKMIRDCYDEVQRAEWGPKAKVSSERKHLPVESFEDAFFPESHIEQGFGRPGRACFRR
jgi:flavin-dependent dehydrogenase